MDFFGGINEGINNFNQGMNQGINQGMNLFPGITPAKGPDEPPKEKKEAAVRRTSSAGSAHGADMIQSPANRDFANEESELIETPEKEGAPILEPAKGGWFGGGPAYKVQHIGSGRGNLIQGMIGKRGASRDSAFLARYVTVDMEKITYRTAEDAPAIDSINFADIIAVCFHKPCVHPTDENGNLLPPEQICEHNANKKTCKKCRHVLLPL